MFKARSVSFLVSLAVLLSTVITSAAELKKIPYYGVGFYANESTVLKDDALKNSLKTILKAGHIRKANDFDEIVSACDNQQNCYDHKAIGYDGARRFLFGFFYLVKKDDATYGLQEMYCDRVYEGADFNKGSQPGPGIIPDNTVINVEHTWPQSRFTGRYPKEMQKSDLHHLFPTDSQMNSLRGNTIFGEVTKESGKEKCNASRYGVGSAGGKEVFEPPQDHKGHVARALFYFSVRYDIAISAEEEVVLRKWNQEHPVDEQEKARNEEIYKAQGNRNPFVDYPELAQEISDF